MQQSPKLLDRGSSPCRGATQRKYMKSKISAEQIKQFDSVEFCSDIQTEKGPSAGMVVCKVEDYVIISHSDTPGEAFKINDLLVKRKSKDYRTNKPLWILY